MTESNSLEEVRANIDRIDRDLVRLLAERGSFVRQAARFKRTVDDVRAPRRVEEVIAKVRNLGTENGLNPDLVEQIYRAMIEAFTVYEIQEHQRTETGV